jgi:hypothetical protein
MSCDPTTLSADAKCFECLDEKMSLAIQTYLLAVSAGGSLDPNVLAEQAKDFQGLSYSQNLQVQAYLLCKIAGINYGRKLYL